MNVTGKSIFANVGVQQKPNLQVKEYKQPLTYQRDVFVKSPSFGSSDSQTPDNKYTLDGFKSAIDSGNTDAIWRIQRMPEDDRFSAFKYSVDNTDPEDSRMLTCHIGWLKEEEELPAHRYVMDKGTLGMKKAAASNIQYVRRKEDQLPALKAAIDTGSPEVQLVSIGQIGWLKEGNEAALEYAREKVEDPGLQGFLETKNPYPDWEWIEYTGRL